MMSRIGPLPQRTVDVEKQYEQRVFPCVALKQFAAFVHSRQTYIRCTTELQHVHERIWYWLKRLQSEAHPEEGDFFSRQHLPHRQQLACAVPVDLTSVATPTREPIAPLPNFRRNEPSASRLQEGLPKSRFARSASAC